MKRRSEEELAVLIAAYAIMSPALEDIEDQENKDSVELQALEIARKVKRIIRANIIYDSRPDYMDKFPSLEEQYKKHGKYATEAFLRAQLIAEKALLSTGSATVNNFTAGVAVLSTYIDFYGGFKHFTVAGKKFIFEAFDAIVEHIETDKINNAIDVATSIVEAIREGVSNETVHN